MIRPSLSRPWAASAAVLALAAMLASGCSTFTDNDVAAAVDGQRLLIDDLDRLAVDLSQPDEFGEFGGTDVRSLITNWIVNTGLADQFDLGDDPAAREAAVASYQDQDPERWDGLGQATKDLLVDFSLVSDHLASSTEIISDEVAEQAYNAGVEESGVLCIRLIAMTDESAASAVSDQLKSGADFATVADENQSDPSVPPNGGVVADADGNECFTAESTPPDILTTLAITPIGVATEPIELNDNFLIILQRPYDEVAESVKATLTTADRVAIRLFADSDVSVASRYGMWDSATATVVPAR